VVTSPLDEINDMLADDSDPEYLRSVTQEEEFCPNPFDGEGTRPAESTGNFTRKEGPFDCEGTRPTESTSNFTRKADQSQRTTNPVGREASKAKHSDPRLVHGREPPRELTSRVGCVVATDALAEVGPLNAVLAFSH
jgi:hypothetical protein